MFLRTLVIAAALLLPSVAAARTEAPATVQVMVLGVYHFDNPGLDIANTRADDPTTPRRQAELARIADALARFKPTRIMVERVGAGEAYAVASYERFSPADLKTQKDEGVQIGYRLARRLGHAHVYGIDERDGPGKPDYFPFDKLQAWSKARGGDARVDAMPAMARASVARIEAAQRRSIGAALRAMNDPETQRAEQGLGYYALLPVGEKDAQPGADLNGGWYLRNAKIFAKLAQASRPGDRVLVVFGGGHGWWLRHFASLTPGFADVSVLPYLPRD